jgi:hypothetical protein
MSLRVQHYTLAKDGSPPEHNDDAVAASLERRRFAVSDGAAESGFSRVWSRLLVDQFVNHAVGEPENWSSWLPATQQRWLAELKDVDIPWYGEQQFAQGSFATFLGLMLGESAHDRRQFQAVAVGDSCVFHTRGGELQSSFPLEHSSQFNNTPRLIGSRSPIEEIIEKRASSARDNAEAGDRLWMMSDALAKWSLAEDEAGQPPWSELEHFLAGGCQAADFATWIAALRSGRGLQNDDVTLLAIEV